jgi:hypothetical protein
MRRREFLTGAVALAAYAQLPRQAGLLTPALGAESGDDQLPFGFHNFTGSNLANWQTALAAQQRGSSNAVSDVSAIRQSPGKAPPAVSSAPMPNACPGQRNWQN